MLLVIGLDGGTWELAQPWIDEGALPNLATLQRGGAHGVLRSTTPPATLPAWTSFSTGQNPGRHGLFDFTRRKFGTYEVSFVNATFRKCPSIWARLSAAGRRVAVLGVPGTYPPEDLNGCIVSGFDTPVTTRADASFVRPAWVASLVREAGGFPFADFQEFQIGPGWHRMARDRLLEGIAKKTRLARMLLARERWDCFALVFGESDTAAHHFWHCHDARSPRRSRDLVEGVGDVLFAVYRGLDAAIGELMEAAQPDSYLVLSDHGFGGAGTTMVHLNGCLTALGFQARAESSRPRIFGAMKRAALTTLPADLQPRLFRLGGGRWASRLESRSRFAGIDWSKTTAYSEELNYFPSVWLNLNGREPQGTVANGDFERVRDDVCRGLESIVDPATGERVVARAWRREELYDGPWVAFAPDIVLELSMPDGYSYNCMPTASARSAAPVYACAPEELTGKLSGMPGSHRPEGMLILGGNGVRRGEIVGAGIEDAGSTVLNLCGVDAPSDLDGRVLSGASTRTTARLSPSLGVALDESAYSAEEEREIEERLSALGYLE